MSENQNLFRMGPVRLVFGSLWIFVLLANLNSASSAEPISYNDVIRPILADHCFQCHGPDEKTRKADLRLDQKEGLFGAHGSREATVIPGDAQGSELVLRIFHDDPEDIMPPPETKKPLTDSQKSIIRQWVQSGAPYQDHWAFMTPAKPTLPNPVASPFLQNPIDNFIAEKLEELGLNPSQEADRSTLIRRAYFDLTGLPPTSQAVEGFLNDSDPRAYETLIDELLASERFGERMTLAWMDAARYGDSSVFHADGVRHMWPWRDWVIQAHNNNMPFDQFTVEQLAGDLIPDATTSQKIASGFNRNHGTTDEGGAIDEEYRVEYIVDRVKTTSNVWLGLSMECSQCHDHKYDPISQKEYYQFYAYFNVSSDPGMQTRNGNTAPLVQIFSESQTEQLQGIRSRLATVQKSLQDREPDAETVSAWVHSLADKEPKPRPGLGPWYQAGPYSAANQTEAFNKRFGAEKSASIDTSKPFGQQPWTQKDYADATPVNLELPDNSAVYLHRTIQSLSQSQWTASLGSDDGIKLFLNGKEIMGTNNSRAVGPDQDKALLDLVEGTNHLLLKVVNGGGNSGFYFDLRESPLPDNVLAAVQKSPTEWNQDDRKVIRSYYLDNIWEEGKSLRDQLRTLQSDEKSIMDSVVTSMVMGDQGSPRKTYVLDRGHYASPKLEEEILPGVPAALPALPMDAPANRLGLAQWLVDPAHPLTARVAVNRYWMMFFGDGLVSTVADFGTRGAIPINQKLLDWLAVDFVESGWNVKRLIRLMLTSGTYRQSSHVGNHHRELDPENRYYARSPRFRLEGEFIRDNALALSGLLNDKIGGPSVNPYQPPRIWNEVSLDGNLFYKRDDGEKLYRRTMYTYWKRSAPNPSMITFDAPTREKCVIQRQRTNTPLQALVTMNDVTFVEAARVWAQNLILSMPDASFRERLDHAFVMSTARPADELRQNLLEDLYQSQLAHFQTHLTSAEELIKAGDYPLAKDIHPAELAAWTIIASTILNLDEVLTRD